MKQYDSRYFDRYRSFYRFADGSPATRADYDAYSASLDKSFDFLWGIDTKPYEGQKVVCISPKGNLLDDLQPTPEKTFGPHEVQNIAMAIAAVREGLLDGNAFGQVCSFNLKLPEDQGSGMVGEVYNGSIRDNLGYLISDVYIEGTKRVRYLNPLTETSENRKIIDPERLTYESDERGWLIRWSTTVAQGHFESLDAAKEYVRQEFDGSPIYFGDVGYSAGAVGCGHFQHCPELYDLLVEQFLNNPVRLYRAAMDAIGAQMVEDQAGIDLMILALEKDREERFAKSPEGRRIRMRIVDGESSE